MSDGNVTHIKQFLSKESPAFILLCLDSDLNLQVIDSYTNGVLEAALNWHLVKLSASKTKGRPS